MIKKTITALSAVLMLTASISSKAQNPTWALNENYYDGAQHLIPSGTGYAYMPSYSANMISDQSGNPLFYVYENQVIDKLGNAIGYFDWYKNIRGTGASSTNIYGASFDYVAGYSETAIVPDPVNCKKYYVFTAGNPTGTNNNPTGEGGIYRFDYKRFMPFYGVVDVSNYSSGGTPTLQQFPESQEISPSGSTLVNFNVKELFTQIYPANTPAKSTSIYWAASPKIGTGNSSYNYVFLFDGTSIYNFKLDISGVSYLSSSEFVVPGASLNSRFRSELELVKLSNGNFRLGFSFEGTTYDQNIGTVDYNTSGLAISSSFASKPVGQGTGHNGASYIHGIEFTPSGDKLVFTNQLNNNITSRVNYISDPYASSIITAVPNIPSNSDLSFSQIEIRNNGSTPYMFFSTTNWLMSLDITASNPSSWVWNSSAVSAGSYPFGPTANFDMNFPDLQYKMFLLPDQIDGMDYGAFNNGILNSVITAPSTICQGNSLIVTGNNLSGNTVPTQAHCWILEECNQAGISIPGGYSSGFLWNTGNPGTFTFPGSNLLACNKYYRIKLALSNNNFCLGWQEAPAKIVYVACNPVPEITTGGADICPGSSWTLCTDYMPSSTISTYWGMPKTLNKQCITVTPSAAGQYPYSVTVTNLTTGCAGQATAIVNVLDNNPDFTLGGDLVSGTTYTCHATPASQTATLNPNFRYSWTVEEIDPVNGNVVPNTTVSNPWQCWISYGLGTNSFSGYNGTNNFTCGTPGVGQFLTNHKYRVTRGTWIIGSCTWIQTSKTIHLCTTCKSADGKPVFIVENDFTTPDYSSLMDNQTSSSIENNHSLNIFPNPSNGLLSINVKNAIDKFYTLEVFDVYGKLIYKNEVSNVTGSEFNTEINLTNLNLSNGLYLVNVNSDNQMLSQRIIIQK